MRKELWSLSIGTLARFRVCPTWDKIISMSLNFYNFKEWVVDMEIKTDIHRGSQVPEKH